jgi:hypothetical protein
MKFNIISGVATMVLALSTAAAFAQSQSGTINQPSWTNEYNPKVKPPAFSQDDMGGASSSKTNAGQYHQGAAEDLTPSSTMGQYQQSSATATKTKSQ